VTHGDEGPCQKWANIISNKFGLNPSVHNSKGRNWFNGDVYSVDLQRNFDALFGKGCKTKTLPDVWMRTKWKKEVFDSFIKGFYLGDGFKTISGRIFEITNTVLASQIVLKLLENGYRASAQYRKYIHFNKSKNNGVYNGNVDTGFTFPTSTDNSGFFNTQGQWFQTLGTKLQKLSNRIHQLTLRGGANFMVVSPTVATIIESIPGFAANSNGDAADMEYAFGVQKAGQFNSRYTVYKNPYMTENTILVGFRGKQFLEAGAVFAPYIPLIMTPLVYDPDTFVPRKGLLTRYAKKMVRPEYYGRIYVSGLNTL